MKNNILNPFFYYSFSFILAIFFYSLDWSDLYPKLSTELLVFIFSTVVLSIFAALLYNKFFSRDNSSSGLRLSDNNIYLISLLMLSLIALEFIYNGGIPLIQTLIGIFYDYTEFGIPVLHVLILPYITLLGYTYFYRYVLLKEKKYLIPVFISYLFPILIVNRSTVMMLVFGCMFIYLFYNFSIRKIIYGGLVSVALLFSFGLAGDYRMKSLGYNAEDGILLLGQANSNFENSILPKQFFWSYLYVSSPLANLQVAQNTYIYRENSFEAFLLNNIVIDAVSKRIESREYSDAKLIDESLNVRTFYGDAMSQLRFMGCILLYIYYVFSVFIFSLLVSKRFLIVMKVILCILSLFVIFTNLLHLSGFILMFIILIIFSRIKSRISFV